MGPEGAWRGPHPQQQLFTISDRQVSLALQLHSIILLEERSKHIGQSRSGLSQYWPYAWPLALGTAVGTLNSHLVFGLKGHM